MLKITSSIKLIDYDLTIDDYVPFSFRCNCPNSEVPFYWRTGNFKTSLIEIGITPSDATLCRLVISCFKTSEIVSERWKMPEANVFLDSVPSFGEEKQKRTDLEKVGLSIRDCHIDFKAIIGLNFCSFLLSENKTVSCYVMNRVCLEFDANDYLIKISFINLVSAEIDKIRIL